MSKRNLMVFLLGAFLFATSAQAQISQWVYKYFPQKPEKYAYPQRISFASKKIKDPEKALKEDGEYLALSSGEKLIIDFGADVGGFFEFKIKLKKPAKIRLYYAEALEFARGKKKYYLFFSPSHRNLLARTYKVSESGWFQDPVLMGGARYLVFEVSAGRLELDGVRCKKSFYPCNPAEAGWFLSSDELLNRIWYAGYYTTCLNTVRPDQGGLSGKERIGVGDWVIIDGAKRDRLVWSGDLQIANRVVYATSGKYEFARNSLESLAKDQFKTGGYPACSVADIGKQVADDFLEYTIWQVINSYDYYFYSGDKDFLEKNYPGGSHRRPADRFALDDHLEKYRCSEQRRHRTPVVLYPGLPGDLWGEYAYIEKITIPGALTPDSGLVANPDGPENRDGKTSQNIRSSVNICTLRRKFNLRRGEYFLLALKGRM